MQHYFSMIITSQTLTFEIMSLGQLLETGTEPANGYQGSS
jgi:hypothetical protein